MQNARQIALNLVNRMENNAYSNLILNKALQSSDLDDRNKRFVSTLFYGVIERKITLDYYISKFSSKPLDKLDDVVLGILRLGIYQLIYMDSVPDVAAVDESVKLTRLAHKSSASGFVNAILRNIIRADKKVELPENFLENMSVRYSCPEWLIENWLKFYGEEHTEDILKSTVGKPKITARVNTNKISSDELVNVLKSEGIKSSKNEYVDFCLDIDNIIIEKCQAFKDGLFHIQDVSSQICCDVLGAKENDIVLDVCAAPGGKSFTIAENMNGTGKVLSFDLHEKRVKLIKDGIKRLSLKNVVADVSNAKEDNANMPMADKILCDVPCAGFGVISKKPEIKYKKYEELQSLPEIQFDILQNTSKYLKVGGELVYSTCSLDKRENDMVIERFLNKNTQFEGVSLSDKYSQKFKDYKATIFPSDFNSDGFFISKIRRVK